jgi:predicted dehydrogenase
MARRLRWGVLGAAAIAVKKVVPGMRRCVLSEVTAIASRDGARAQAAAADLGLPRAYGSYEELLDDPEIDVVYNPLPNHLHAEWTTRAAEHGKHVLCEKPITVTVEEAEGLLAVRDRTGVHIQEAFMVRTHPQWLAARDLARGGRIGALRSVVGAFSYFNDDPGNVRNVAAYGGGGLMDIGCYPVTIARFLYGEEPRRVLAALERDPRFGTDRLASAVLDFPSGHAVFTCGTQMVPYQTVQALGTRGRIAVEIPFNAPPDRPCRIQVDDGSDLFGGGSETFTFETCDQYALQADAFSRAVLDGTPQPVPLEDSVANMRVIRALVRSAESGTWEAP